MLLPCPPFFFAGRVSPLRGKLLDTCFFQPSLRASRTSWEVGIAVEAVLGEVFLKKETHGKKHNPSPCAYSAWYCYGQRNDIASSLRMAEWNMESACVCDDSSPVLWENNCPHRLGYSVSWILLLVITTILNKLGWDPEHRQTEEIPLPY